MASIARRPDGTYRPRYRDEHGKEHARHFKRKVDAQRWLDEVTAAVQTGTYVDPGRAKLTVGELADVWLTGKINLKPTTRARFRPPPHTVRPCGQPGLWTTTAVRKPSRTGSCRSEAGAASRPPGMTGAGVCRLVSCRGARGAGRSPSP